MTTFLASGYLALGTGTGATLTEVSGTGYSRAPITMGPLEGATTRVQQAVTFNNLGASPWNVTQFAVADASNNILLVSSFDVGFTVAAGRSWGLPASQGLTLTFPDAMIANEIASRIYPPGLAIGVAGSTNRPIYAGPANVKHSAGSISLF